METGRDNTAFGSMISIGFAFRWKAITSLMSKLSIITDETVRKDDMQNDIEVRELIVKLDGDITTIKPYAAVAT